MSVIYYKFKSAKDFDTVTFDGISLSVFDLKHEIMIAKKLGKGTDFDLAVYNAQTGEEYTDDLSTIPRNTSIIVGRFPPERPGKGTAQKYLSAAGPSTHVIGRRVVNNGTGKPIIGGKNKLTINQSTSNPTKNTVKPEETLEGLTEEERINSMFQKSNEHWKQTQDQMANARSIPFRPHQHIPNHLPNNATDGKHTSMPQRVPQPGYVCFRCGQKGHFISNCPTIGDKEYDRPKLKKTTGIPKSFLKPVDNKQATEGGVMVTQDGDLVVVQPNEQEWKRMNVKVGTAFGEDIYNNVPIPKELSCPLCMKLFRDAVSIPCCGESYCDECIREHLLKETNTKMRCPNCNQEQSPDNLVPNKSIRQAVEHHIIEYINKKNNENKETEEEATTSNEKKEDNTEKSSIPNNNNPKINNGRNINNKIHNTTNEGVNKNPRMNNRIIKNGMKPNLMNRNGIKSDIPGKSNPKTGKSKEYQKHYNNYGGSQSSGHYNPNYNNGYYNNKMIPTYMNDNYRNYQEMPLNQNNNWNMGNDSMLMWEGVPGVMMNSTSRPLNMNQVMPPNMNMGMMRPNSYKHQLINNQDQPMTRGQKVYQTYERRIQFRQQKKRTREMDVIDITEKKVKN